jgi:hypothetical protein
VDAEKKLASKRGAPEEAATSEKAAAALEELPEKEGPAAFPKTVLPAWALAAIWKQPKWEDPKSACRTKGRGRTRMRRESVPKADGNHRKKHQQGQRVVYRTLERAKSKPKAESSLMSALASLWTWTYSNPLDHGLNPHPTDWYEQRHLRGA